MHTITARNVNGAYHAGLNYLLEHGQREESRNGPVLVAPGPVTTIYERPCERVLFTPRRDANCLFHIAEAMWMLGGRRDAAFLNRYVKDFGARFAEPHPYNRIHGAYGHRWRHAMGFDQLKFIIEKFKQEPTTRQCVLQMWDSSWVVDYGSDDLRGDFRDRPCNTHAYFRIKDGSLDMMVCCRSNDAVWGAYGANAVHFSFLQEYLAAMIGVKVGVYHQMSFNFHAYTNVLEKLGEPELDDRYALGNAGPVDLVDDPDIFDEELQDLLAVIDNDSWATHDRLGYYQNRFLGDTVAPMLYAHSLWRHKGGAARERALDVAENEIAAPDWRTAAVEWMERRLRRAASR